MDILTDPYSKADLITALRQVNQKVTYSFRTIPAERFFQANAENWSPAENLVHMIKSVSPVSKAIKLPEMLAAGVFGTAQRPSMRYPELKGRYLEFVLNGLQTTAPYTPTINAAPADAEQEKQTTLAKWHEVSERLLNALNAWTEDDLDQRTLPHPILGDLTVREMLFFTLIHSLLHANEARVFMGERTLAI
jgi:hypothetical protein